MTEDDPEHQRRSIRLHGHDYSAAGGYFVTVVAFQRKSVFGELVEGEARLNALGRIVRECWNEIPSHFPNAGIDAFVAMPNHIHGIILIHEDNQRKMSIVGRRMRRPTPAWTVPAFPGGDCGFIQIGRHTSRGARIKFH